MYFYNLHKPLWHTKLSVVPLIISCDMHFFSRLRQARFFLVQENVAYSPQNFRNSSRIKKILYWLLIDSPFLARLRWTTPLLKTLLPLWLCKSLRKNKFFKNGFMSGEEFMVLGKYHRGKVYDFLEEYSALLVNQVTLIRNNISSQCSHQFLVLDLFFYLSRPPARN